MNMGSAVHATYHSINKTPIELMICLEMIGFFTDEKIQDYPLKILHLFYPKRGFHNCGDQFKIEKTGKQNSAGVSKREFTQLQNPNRARFSSRN